jgi:hypothetical protein
MKTLAILITGLALLTASANAQLFSIAWFELNGGGSTSTGGNYTLTGNPGPPAAGQVNGDAFSLLGGFLGMTAATQPSDPPSLSAWCINTTIVVTWPASAAGWVLEVTVGDPTPASVWTAIPPPYGTDGAHLLFSEPLPLGSKFYRLRSSP